MTVFAVLALLQDPIEEFQKRVKVLADEGRVRVSLDDQEIWNSRGAKAEIKIEESGGQKAIVLLLDGKEQARVTVPKLDVTPLPLPPLTVKDAEGCSVKSESSSVNGVSTCKVTIDGKVVYNGPGSSAKATARDDNGNKFVEVVVDGVVVYRVGQPIPEKEPPK